MLTADKAKIKIQLVDIVFVLRPNLYPSRSQPDVNQMGFFSVPRNSKAGCVSACFLGAYLSQILKEMKMIILVNFAFVVHVLI